MRRYTQFIPQSRYAAAVIMNSTYEYEPASRKDEFIELGANTLNIILPILRPDRGAIFGAFPWCTSHSMIHARSRNIRV